MSRMIDVEAACEDCGQRYTAEVFLPLRETWEKHIKHCPKCAAGRARVEEAEARGRKARLLSLLNVPAIIKNSNMPAVMEEIPPGLTPELEQWVEDGRGFLGITGKVGRGKTVLACMVGLAWAQRHARVEGGDRVLYPSLYFEAVSDLVGAFRSAITDGVSEDTIVKRYRSYGLLILDDFGIEHDKAYAQAVIYRVIDNRERRGLPTIWTSNLGTDTFRKVYGERMLSRMAAGLTVELTGEDRRLKGD